jgi:hypothetical protein
MTQNSGPEPAAWKPPAMSVRVMMPMVFCASLVPCARATSDDVKIWP